MPEPTGDLEQLLVYLDERRHFDFRGYKRASLARRIAKRMQAVGVDDYQDYVAVLEANPGEFAQMFDTILINVTALARDPDAWDFLAERVIPDLAERESPEGLRVWSAGCATGEEAYTLAVYLADALGEERFRRDVKIYATDADGDALVAARQGRYAEADLVNAFGEDRARRFFEIEGGWGTFRPDLRRALIFGQHDLVQDPPISRVDLLSCRNTLMYFTAPVQDQVLADFEFALVPGGYLMLGKAETLVSHANAFEAVGLRAHVFRRTDAGGSTPAIRRNRPLATVASRRPETVVEQAPSALLVVDQAGILVSANRAARRLLGLGSAALGRSLRDLDLAGSPGEVRSAVERCLRDRRTVTLPDLTLNADDRVTLDAVVAPLEPPGGAIVELVDVSRIGLLREELVDARRELQTAYEELQSTVEELETTNEELQSTNEELETTNEELHSTNEELETMNEELQSTNEELETINNELRDRAAEVQDLNLFLSSILSSLQTAVVVLGPEMEVRAWNRQAEEVWGLRSAEVVGQHFLNLDIGFPVEQLRGPVRDVLTGRSERGQVAAPAVKRRGRPVECSVGISPLVGDGGQQGVILMMDVTAVVPG